jgi:glycerate kinase
LKKIGKIDVKIVCAPDSFKESLSASAVCQAMTAGITRADPSIQADACPVADGGEGTLEVVVAAFNGTIFSEPVSGPAGDSINARFGVSGDRETGIVELAEASGLSLIPKHRRDPTRTTTFGVGQLIASAARRGCQTIIVGLGGSATVDGGAGAAQALGAKFFDCDGREMREPMTGGALKRIGRIDRSAMSSLPLIRLACDVTNPLCGPEGAARVYGPQKGATPEQVREIDAGLVHFATLCSEAAATADPDAPGSGAAGGAGFGLAALCGATLERGIDLVLDAIGFAELCRDASLVLTGEGRLDAQSLTGKACMGVAAAAAKLGVPTIAIVGMAGPGAEDCINSAKGGMLASYISLADRFGRERAIDQTAALIAQVAQEVASKCVCGSRE